MTDQEAAEALNESVDFSLNAEGINLSFTLPEGERDWDIRLSQNVSSEDPDVIQSFNETQWTPGESYSFFLPRDILLEYHCPWTYLSMRGRRVFPWGFPSAR